MNKSHNVNLALLCIRIALGVVFINAGWLKMTNMPMVVTAFGSMGIPAFLAYFVAYAEFVGGILMLLGIWARYVGVVLAIIMMVAMFKVHWINGFSLANGGYEYVFVLLLNSLAMISMGGGKYSVACLFKKSSPTTPAV